MGNCVPSSSKPTVDMDVEVDGNSCCFDINIRDKCPSNCCYINIYRNRTRTTSHKDDGSDGVACNLEKGEEK